MASSRLVLPAAFSPEIRFSPGENEREAVAILRKSQMSSDCNPMANSGLTVAGEDPIFSDVMKVGPGACPQTGP